MTNQHHVDIGDTVRVGKGYQRWTVTGRDGEQLTLQSDPNFAATWTT